MTPHNNPIIIPTIEDLTRRQFMSSALAAALLIACSDEEEPAPEKARMHLVTDALGNEVEIPLKPQRVVSVSTDHVVGLLLSLGLPVIGGISGRGFPPSVTDFFDVSGIEDLGEGGNNIDFEAVALAEPDLIVAALNNEAGRLTETDEARARAIAPLVYIQMDGGGSVVDYVPAAARLFGTDETAFSEQAAELDSILAEIRKVLGPRPQDITANVINPSSDNIQVRRRLYFNVSQVLNLAGVSWSALVQEADRSSEFYVPLSYEEMRRLDCDLIVSHVGIRQTVLQNNDRLPLWEQLPAVQAKQVLLSDEEDAGISLIGRHYPGIIAAAKYVLRKLSEMPQPIRTDII